MDVRKLKTNEMKNRKGITLKSATVEQRQEIERVAMECGISIYIRVCNPPNDFRWIFFKSNNEISACRSIELGAENYVTFQEFIAHMKRDEFKRGDLVDVKNNCEWFNSTRIYTGYKVEGASHPYICVSECDENRFNYGEQFGITAFKNIRKHVPPVVKMTLDEVRKLTGIDNLEIEQK